MKKIIVGTCIRQDNKILMVQEAKQKVYGKWNFPAGHLEDNEDIFDGAIRETKEETGYDVKLTGALPIINYIDGDADILRVTFIAEIVGGSLTFNKDELLDIKWIPINEIKQMTNIELRAYPCNMDILQSIEAGISYPLEIFKNIITNINE